MIRDPRSEAEKARADLVRNSEMGMAVPESPLEEEPSVTAKTFGDTTAKAEDRSKDAGVEAGGRVAPIPPKERSEADISPRRDDESDDDVLSRAKE